MGNQLPATAQLTIVYSTNGVMEAGMVSTKLQQGEQISVEFQAGPHGTENVASTAGKGAAKKMYKVKRCDTGEFYALKTPGTREDVIDHVVAATYAKDFGQGIRFVVPALAHVDIAYDQGGHHVAEWMDRDILLEPLLEGVYEKFVCRRHKFGDGTFIYHPLPQAFFHYTYESSGKALVIWDLQGVRDENGEYLLTDPYIVHDENTIWRYGKHHDTFRILHTRCNSRCPQNKRVVTDAEDESPTDQNIPCLPW